MAIRIDLDYMRQVAEAAGIAYRQYRARRMAADPVYRAQEEKFKAEYARIFAELKREDRTDDR